MFKTSVATKLVSFSVLIALLFAFSPTAAAAKGNSGRLEAKWAKLVDTYKRQTETHNGAHRSVAQWMADHPRAAKSKKAEIQKSLAASDTAWAAATAVLMSHNGFDAKGNIVDKAAAQQSVKDLSKALHRYTASIKNLRALIRQYNLEV